MTLCG